MLSRWASLCRAWSLVGFGVQLGYLGFRGLGFRVLGFKVLGFRGLGFRVGVWA